MTTTFVDTEQDERDRVRIALWIEQLALQERDQWRGFGPFTDEYLLPAMRYRIWAASIALSFLQYCHTPAYSGYRAEAGRALIERYTHHLVWRYWRRENLWGMLRTNPDPIGTRANVMFTGYLLLALSMYQRATGDTAFSEPESLVFTTGDGRHRFGYDHERIAVRTSRNFAASRLTLWPCEPGLVFPFCNTVALVGLLMRDTMAGSGLARPIIGPFLQSLHTEFTAADGDIVPFQASRFGAALRGPRGITNTAQIAALLAPLDPAFAWRSWHLLLREELEPGHYRRTGEPGSLAPTDLDWGGQQNRANALGWGMFLARERGEHHWYRQLREAAGDLETSQEQAQPFEVSPHAAGILSLGMVGRPGAWQNMLLGEHAEPSGPRLAEATWPAVAVATARTDGTSHDAVLYPDPHVRGGVGRQRLGYDGLTPGGHYRVTGAAEGHHHVAADEQGRAVVEVDLNARRALRLQPAERPLLVR